MQEKPTKNNTQLDNTPPIESANTVPMQTVSRQPVSVKKSPRNPFKRFGAWYWRHKKWTIALTIALLLIILLAIPFSRYPMISWFWKQDVSFRLTDSRNGTPVSNATLNLAGKTAKTDKEGVAKLNDIPVGPQKIEITKKYYKSYSSDILVSEFGNNQQNSEVSLEATGRMVTVTIQNTISGKNIDNASIAAGDDNKATTSQDGKTTIVVPADKNEIDATVNADGFNKKAIKLIVTDDDKKNTFGLTPSGNIYFLSKQSGKVDVVKTGLDGSDRKTVFAGTGKEDDRSTALLASRDWKYLVLKTKREANQKAALYLISTADDTVVPLDGGDADFSLVGWAGHRFIYQVDRSTPVWQANHSVLKSFNAETKQITNLDQTAAEGNNQFDSRYELIGSPYILANSIVYVKTWNKYYQAYGTNFNGKQSGIFSIKADGTSKQTLKTLDPHNVTYIVAALYAPQEIYFSLSHIDGKQSYLELEDGTIKNAPNDTDLFNKSYPTFLVSPNGKATFWAEARDGKNVLFVGDANGQNGKEVLSSSDYSQYGWFTDDYLLVAKNRSELFILSKDGLKNNQQPLKIADYHKPFSSYPGYGYGYGGI